MKNISRSRNTINVTTDNFAYVATNYYDRGIKFVSVFREKRTFRVRKHFKLKISRETPSALKNCTKTRRNIQSPTKCVITTVRIIFIFFFQRAQLGSGYSAAAGNQGLANANFGGKSGAIPAGHHSGPPGMTGNYASGAPTQYHHRPATGWNSAPLPAAQQYRYGTGPVTQATTMSPYSSYNNPNPTATVSFSTDFSKKKFQSVRFRSLFITCT